MRCCEEEKNGEEKEEVAVLHVHSLPILERDKMMGMQIRCGLWWLVL